MNCAKSFLDFLKHCLPSKSCILTESPSPSRIWPQIFLVQVLQCTQCLDDVLILQKLSTSYLSDAVLPKHSFSNSLLEQYAVFLTEKSKVLKSLQPLIDLKKISNTVAEKISASGLSLGHLQLGYSRGRVDGLSNVLTERLRDSNPF